MGKTNSPKPETAEEAETPQIDEAETSPPVDQDLLEKEEADAEVKPEVEPYEELETEAAEQEAELNPEAKRVLEANYPVLREHGSHNAAVNGLQTSPGYDPTKL